VPYVQVLLGPAHHTIYWTMLVSMVLPKLARVCLAGSIYALNRSCGQKLSQTMTWPCGAEQNVSGLRLRSAAPQLWQLL